MHDGMASVVLVEKDFELMFPDKVNMKYKKWPQLTP